MSSVDFNDEKYIEIIDEVLDGSASIDRDEGAEVDQPAAHSPVNFSLSSEAGFEKKYSISDLQKLSEYLNRESSSRYRAIVLNVWSGTLDSAHFEVGLVQIRNGDHRNGVVHALRVSPFNVKFVQLEDSFFEYLYSHIYDERTQNLVLEHQQKKQSQKTKNWGEGKTFLTAEEAYATQAASEADRVEQSEEWIDLTDSEEYERNIRRNEAELTTQEFIRLILMEFLRSGSSD